MELGLSFLSTAFQPGQCIFSQYSSATSLEESRSVEDYFASTEEDGASTEGFCTGTEEDNFNAAEQELDEESVAVQKEAGWISG